MGPEQNGPQAAAYTTGEARHSLTLSPHLPNPQEKSQAETSLGLELFHLGGGVMRLNHSSLMHINIFLFFNFYFFMLQWCAENLNTKQLLSMGDCLRFSVF